MPPPKEDDLANEADRLRRLEARKKRTIWITIGAVTMLSIGAGFLVSRLHAGPAASGALILALFGVVAAGTLLLTRKSSKTWAALRTPRALALRREGMDRTYRRFLLIGPALLTLMSLLEAYVISGWKPWDASQPMTAIHHVVTIAPFLMVCFLYYTQFHGQGRGLVEDEMVAVHRGQGYVAGFAAAMASGLVLATLAIAEPKIAAVLAAPLFALPLIAAMVRFGLLERAAATDG
jgi:hypothetical protein